ncbi:translocation/assembly module TamB [Halanaerobium sp. Z-7514]|uniref:Translocation/assembly module TamB n=1 Tax=Halanaerobium polyolivorans TaxID=2886943 RepID=A0AAW4WYV2_9FIRM|nr:translocation/assembly module TamB domain-containing protein [Halanaerobium polyolivorans]MCC3144899.1 translocation/assembly module TamB [Halanaerobium polyolivorans]
MDKQIKYLIGVLIFLILAAYVFSLLSGLPRFFEDDIIALLEREIGGDIAFESISLWPLNRINLKEFEYSDELGNSFRAEEFELDYSLNFRRDNGFIGIEFIGLKNAVIEIEQLDFELPADDPAPDDLEQEELETQLAERAAELKLPAFLANFDLNIEDSVLHSRLEDYDFSLSSFNLGLRASSREEFELNFGSEIELREVLLPDGQNISAFNLDKLELNLKQSAQQTDFYLNTSQIDLAQLRQYIELQNYNLAELELEADKLEGRAAFKGQITLAEGSIQNYNAEIGLEDLKLPANYKYQTEAGQQREDFLFSLAQGDLLLDGPEFRAVFAKNLIDIDNNIIQLAFKYSLDGSFEIEASADAFRLDYDFLAEYIEEGIFDFNLAVQGEDNSPDKGSLDLKANNLSTALDFEIAASSFEFRLLEENIFLDSGQFNFADGGELNLKGNYNYNNRNYLLKAEAEELKLNQQLQNLIEQFEIDNAALDILLADSAKELDFLIDTAGIYTGDRDLSSTGELSLDLRLSDDKEFSFLSSFWYYEEILNLSSFKMESDYGRIDLSGEINFNEEILDLSYAGRDIDPTLIATLNGFEQEILADLNTVFDHLEGSISSSFNNPRASLTAEMSYLSYQNYHLENLTLRSVYEDHNLELQRFSADLNQGELRGSGRINNLVQAAEAEIDLSFNTDNFYYNDLAEIIDRELPLAGAVNIELALAGTLLDPDINLFLEADNTIFMAEAQEFEFSTFNARISRENSRFELEELNLAHQDLVFNAAGSYDQQDGFAIDYQLNNFELNQYLGEVIPRADTLSGVIDLEGELRGDIFSPQLNFSLFSDSLRYQNLEIEFIDNSFSYLILEDILEVEIFEFMLDQGSYDLSGELADLRTSQKADLELELLDVPVKNTAEKFAGFYPLAEDMILNGQALITGEGQDISAQLDIEGSFSENQNARFELGGQAGRELDLNFSSADIPIDFVYKQFDYNLSLIANFACEGGISGSIDAPLVELEHRLTEITLNEIAVKSLEGELSFADGNFISLQERIEFPQGGNLQLEGSYSILEDELNLNSEINEMPIAFLLSFFSEDMTADGQIDGNVRVDGSIEEAILGGEIRIAGRSLDIGLSHQIRDYNALIELRRSNVIVQRLDGYFADGNFDVRGNIDLFAEENAWNLDLKGERLYFLRGSVDGEFNLEGEFTGPLLDPVLTGDLEAFNMEIGIPFVWPEPQFDEDDFIPRVDIDIVPLDEVRVRNPNMNVLVQSGSLNINFDNTRDDALEMEGRLRSDQGVFNYYNSRFNLVNGQAIFTPVDEDNIPTLRVNAVTYAGGREININLTGPADNMRITLTSTPEMTEEEILHLLTTRGALGSAILGDEEVGIENIIFQELVRLLNVFLQEDVISEIESDFQRAFALDRIEIDAFQYGLEREFAIYLGKNITDSFYLEYANFFAEGEDRESEISFQYRLTDITSLKGSYVGDDEYQISIETEFGF